MYVYCDKVSNIINSNSDYNGNFDKKLLGENIVKIFNERIASDSSLKQTFKEENEKEQQSWENSIPELLSVIAESGLADLFVVFEYELPVGKNRIDCTIIGRNKNNEICILIVELKQWVQIYKDANNNNPCKVKLTADDIEREHPLAQIQTYSKYLENNHTFCAEKNVKIYKCAYLHNFIDKDELFKEPYHIYKKFFYDITFTKNDREKFKDMLNDIFINEGRDEDVEAFCNGDYKIGKDGLEELHNVLKSNEAITLLDEQRDIISLFGNALNSLQGSERIVEVISGNVGSGKTYLAFEMLRRAIKQFGNKGCYYTLVNATVREIVNEEFDDKIALYTDTVTSPSKRNNIVIIDEAHRISNVKDTMYKLLYNSRIVIILQDDKQRILFSEEGTRENYEKVIEELSAHYNIKRLADNGQPLRLKTDLRTNARSGFIESLNRFLDDGELEESNYLNEFYDLEINDDLNDIDAKLKAKDEDNQCKWVASFCWDWTRNTENNDIVIGDFKKAWNPQRQGKKQYDWYKNIDGHHLDEVGCIYTLQGLDFDYTGAIFWNDLYWKDGKWNIDLNKIKDQYFFISDIAKKFGGSVERQQEDGHWFVRYKNNRYEINEFIDLISKEKQIDLRKEVIQIVKNIYRVLLSRAKKGMYIWFKGTETKKRFIKAFNL